MDDTAQRPIGPWFSKDKKPDEKGAYPQTQLFPVEKLNTRAQWVKPGARE